MPLDLPNLLKFAVANRASDIHLQANAAPMLRVAGRMRALEMPKLEKDELRQLIQGLLPSHLIDNSDERLFNGIDFSFTDPDIARFRCSAYRQLGMPGLVMRVVPTKAPDFKDLNLPAVLEDIALSRRGLTLVTGTTGSGKSTTLAAMLNLINRTYPTKIISIEDPIEFLFQGDKSMISQLEVGQDTPSFEQGLRQALRQDPDVIMVGELRDVETLRIALRAADTGHQVLSTVHSADTAQTIERVIAMFPPAEHKILLSQLSHSIEAIVGQRLVTTRDDRRVPAVEVLRGSGVTERFIENNQIDELGDYIATGELGMQTYDQHLLELYNAKTISGTQALQHASNTEALSLAMRGIRRVGGGLGS